MNEAAAKQIAETVRAQHDVTSGYRLRHAERRIIELLQSRTESDAWMRDVRVWVVRFQDGIRWIDLAIDEVTGDVVRVEKSR